MTEEQRTELSEPVVRIVSSFASRESATTQDIIELLTSLRQHIDGPAIASESLAPSLPEAHNVTALKATPAVPISDSVTDDRVVCLCCGKSFTMLKRHLMAEHGLTEEQYRIRFGLPDSHPLVAPNYSVRKAEYAKRIGLGRYSRAVGMSEGDSSSA